MHDFRIEPIRDDLTRVYFDLVIPYEDKRSEEEVIRLIQKSSRSLKNGKLSSEWNILIHKSL